MIVTHERNGYAVWTDGAHMPDNPLGMWRSREEAMEHAVDLARSYLQHPDEARKL